MTRRQAVFTMLLVTFMWSIAGVVSRQLEGARSFEVTFWRSAFTALALLVLLPAVQGAGAFRRVAWRNPALWLSGLCWAVMFTAFMTALTLTTVANVLVTMALGPMFTAVLARLALGQALPGRIWGAVAAAGVGIAIMYAPQLASGGNLTGSVVALAVPLAAAVQWTLTQSLQGSNSANGSPVAAPVDLIPAIFMGAMISSAVTLPLAWPFAASATDVAWLGLLGVVQLAIPCALSVACARVLKGPEISLLALLEILFGIALAWAIGGERPSSSVLLGGGVVVIALALSEYWGMRQSK